MGLIKRIVFTCDTCGHEWLPEQRTTMNAPVKPKRCPNSKCKTTEWDAKGKLWMVDEIAPWMHVPPLPTEEPDMAFLDQL